jgi:tetratricopeptide (TPR) repeat protein
MALAAESFMRNLREIVFVVFSLCIACTALAQEPKPRELTPEEKRLSAEAQRLSREGVDLYQRGQSTEAIVKVRKALEITQKLFPPETYPDGHSDLATDLFNLGTVQEALGMHSQAVRYLEQALAMRQKLYPQSTYPNGHREIAVCLDGLGSALQSMGFFAKALPYLQEALAMRRKLYPPLKYPDGHREIANSLNNLGFLFQAMGWYERAMPCFEQSLEMYRKLYAPTRFADGHPDLATGVSNMGFVLEAMGAPEKALPYFREALEIRGRFYSSARFPDGHADLAISLNNLGHVFVSLGSPEQALPYFEKALAMRQKLFPEAKYPDGRTELAHSLINVGAAFQMMGLADKALLFFEQALSMRQRLFPVSKYPNGHPELANSLGSVGVLLKSMAQYEKALPHLEKALAMNRKLYPEAVYPSGHPDTAQSLTNVVALYYATGSFAKALPLEEQSLAMRQKIYPLSRYPDGHPHLAQSYSNLGLILYALGSSTQALAYLEQALAMRQRLYPRSRYPNGHTDLAACLNNIGYVKLATGSFEEAMHYFLQGLAMRRELDRQFVAAAPESEAIAFVRSQQWMCDSFLTLTARLPGSDMSAYRLIWTYKSAISRVLERRHAVACAAGTAQAGKFDELKATRQRIDQLLRDRRMPTVERDKLLTQLTDARDSLERELANALPILDRVKEIDALGPEALLTCLPDHTVLIDFVRYTRFEFDKNRPGKGGESRKTCYSAYVLFKEPVNSTFPAKGQDEQPPTRERKAGRIVRVELQEASAIDSAIRIWREAAERNQESPDAIEQLAHRLWEPIAKHLPAGTHTLYLATDGDLARMPWAALPTGDGKVLLDRYVVAQVPYGMFLLEQLRNTRKYRDDEMVLALGQVAYNSKTWLDLPGTAIELKSLVSRRPLTLTGADATSTRVLAELPKSNYAHFATHGFFDSEALTAEKRREAEAMKNRQFGDESRQVAAKNPLGYVGLVLADGEILSGLGIVDLALENLKLVTLSACETGLGEYTGGEGVQGLQRAFHLAGCPNVIASLWNVNDAATAALMAKFYHELWVKKKPPIEALREAQLTIFYHPELIPDLAGERGAPKLKEAVTLKSEPAAQARDDRKRADTKLWAAFVLSGVGK